MDEKKTIIIEEIMYWKETKLLPEQYCNFLLTLYTEGETTAVETLQNRKNTRRKGFHLALSSSLILLIFVALLVIYFTDFSFKLQIGFLVIFLLMAFFAVYFLKDHQSLGFHIALFVSALLVLLIGTHTILHYFPNQTTAVFYYGCLNCIIWFTLGKKMELKYFTYAGVCGFIVMFMIFIIRLNE